MYLSVQLFPGLFFAENFTLVPLIARSDSYDAR